MSLPGSFPEMALVEGAVTVRDMAVPSTMIR
jgi:hypothetical protein